jgi:hypothetical protein
MNPLQIVDKAEITNDNAAEVAYAIRLARKQLDLLEAKVFEHVKAVEATGQKLDGIIIKEGSQRKVVTDIRLVKKAIKGHVSDEDFIACCTVKLGELQDKFTETFNGTKKDAAALLNDKLNEVGAIETKTSGQSLYIVEAAVKYKFEAIEA